MADLRHQIHVRLQMTLAGHPCDVAYAALLDSLVAMIGAIATDRANADELIGNLEDDVRRAVNENWDELRKVHVAIVSQGAEAGHG